MAFTFPPGLTLDEKFDYVQAVIRADAAKRKGGKRRKKPECGQNQGGVKTVRCGSVCRLPTNCKISKREQGYLEKLGATQEDVDRAVAAKQGAAEGLTLVDVQQEIRKRKAGERSAAAKAKATGKTRPPKPAPEDLSRPGLNPDGSVRLGKPIHARVTTPEEAIANGRAILGNLLQEMQKPSLDDQFEAGELANQKRKKEIDAQVSEMQVEIDRMKEQGASPERISKAEKERIALLIESVEMSNFEFTEEGRKLVSVERANHLVSHLEEIGIKETNPERYALYVELRDEAVREGRYSSPVAQKVIDALLGSSSVSKSDADSIVEGIDLRSGVPEDTKQHLSALVRLTNGQCAETLSFIEVGATGDGRSYAVSPAFFDRGYIRLDPSDTKNIATIYHEVGHHLEYHSNSDNSLAADFIKERATGEPQKLSEITPSSQYKDDEIAYPDHFVTPYVGKIYDRGSSEVISIGLEHFTDSQHLASLAQKDPEHLALVLGVMRQSFDPSDLIQEGKDIVKYKKRREEVDGILDFFEEDLVKKHKPLEIEEDAHDYGDFKVKQWGSGQLYLDLGDYNIKILPFSASAKEVVGAWFASRPDIVKKFKFVKSDDHLKASKILEQVFHNDFRNTPLGHSVYEPDFDMEGFLQTFDPFEIAGVEVEIPKGYLTPLERKAAESAKKAAEAKEVERINEIVAQRQAKRDENYSTLEKYEKSIKRKHKPVSKNGNALDFSDFVAEGGPRGVSLEFANGDFGFVSLPKPAHRLFMSWLKSRPDLYQRFGNLTEAEANAVGESLLSVFFGRFEDTPVGDAAYKPDFDPVKFLETFDPFELAGLGKRRDSLRLDTTRGTPMPSPFPPGLTLDQKFDYALAIAQERRDAKRAAKQAKPNCRSKPVVSRAGNVVKPATIACGSTCRQPKNCDLNASEKRRIQSRVGEEGLRKALLQAKRRKRQGQSGTGAVYEATKEALARKGAERNQGRKRKGQQPKGELAERRGKKQKTRRTVTEALEKYPLLADNPKSKAGDFEVPKVMPAKPGDRKAQAAPVRKALDDLVASLSPEEMKAVGGLIRTAQLDLSEMEAGKRGKDALTNDQYRFGFQNIAQAIQRVKFATGRADSYLSEGYFGLNPNPFHHPLWDLMGY